MYTFFSLLCCSFAFGNVFFSAVESVQNLDKCRGGFMPYDANRVRLDSGQFYNASYLVDRGDLYIVAQTPDPSTEDAFWEVIQQEKIRVVVSLDGGYWPKKGETKICGNCVIKCLDERSERFSQVEELSYRYYVLSNGEERRGVIQYTLDMMGNTTFVSKETLQELIRRVKGVNEGNKPVLVHSDFAVGLTGAYVDEAGPLERDASLLEKQRPHLFYGQKTR